MQIHSSSSSKLCWLFSRASTCLYSSRMSIILRLSTFVCVLVDIRLYSSEFSSSAVAFMMFWFSSIVSSWQISWYLYLKLFSCLRYSRTPRLAESSEAMLVLLVWSIAEPDRYSLCSARMSSLQELSSSSWRLLCQKLTSLSVCPRDSTILSPGVFWSRF